MSSVLSSQVIGEGLTLQKRVVMG
jgi:hypothetical protein